MFTLAVSRGASSSTLTMAAKSFPLRDAVKTKAERRTKAVKRLKATEPP